MSSKWQGALITILEALKDVCLVNEAKEKFGPMSEKKIRRLVRCLLFPLFNVISKTSGKLVQDLQATLQCHRGHRSHMGKLVKFRQAHVTGTALQQHCIMFDERQGRDLHKNREKHVLLHTAPLRAMQGSGIEAGPRWPAQAAQQTPGPLSYTWHHKSTPGKDPAWCSLSS